ncbi:Serum paraoxonase/arylesterase 2 [Linnemannia zychae]|nr:Serum paraoxonase/arylesterase 2 [Linnemannia zychae]
MADSSDTTSPATTLRNRRTAAEDTKDDLDTSPVATTTATSVSTSKPTDTRKGDTEERDLNDKKKQKPNTAQLHRRIAQHQTKKNSQLKNFFLSLLVATLGVIIKSAYEKFVLIGRDIAIEQTVGLQGNCYRTAYIPGPADIEISDHDQLAFVSSDDYSWKKESRFFHRPSTKTANNGGIYTLALNHKNGSPKEVKLESFTSDDFHPAGISLYHFQDDKTHERRTRLFVINHSHMGDVVEIFDFSAQSNTLVFVKSVKSDLFVTPKDIVAVGEDRFYLTNHHAMGSKYGRVVEDISGATMGTVVYYNGKDTHKVLESLNNPYGIAGSPDGKQIYVSSFMDKAVKVYNTTEDISEGQLEHDVDIWIGSHVDNLSVDVHTGDIYVASHPSYATYLRHKMGYQPQSPSHVVKIEKLAPENYIPQESSLGEYYFFPKPDLPPLKWEVKDLFYSNGEDISASTVAAYWNGDLILGSSTSHHLLRCSLRLDQ